MSQYGFMQQYLILFSLLCFLFHCRNVAISSKAGVYSQGTVKVLYEIFLDEEGGYFKDKSENEIKEKFLAKLQEKESLYLLGMRHKMELSEYYGQYIALEQKVRKSKMAFAYWRRKIKPDFAFSDVFQYYGVKINSDEAIQQIANYLANKQDAGKIVLGYYQKGPIFLSDVAKANMSLEFNTFLQLEPKAQKEALPEKIRAFLALLASEEMTVEYGAYESELMRYDMAQVAEKFLKVKYALAHKGIYPDEPFDIHIPVEEIYDVFHREINIHAGVKEAYIDEFAFFKKKEAMDFIKKYGVGDIPEKPTRREKLTLFSDVHRKVLPAQKARLYDMVWQNRRFSEIYEQNGKFWVAHLRKVIRKEEPKVENYIDKISLEIREKILNEQFYIDLQDTKNYLNMKANLKFLG